MVIRPRLGASLKWRPPYVDAGASAPPIDSLRGRVLIQVWPSRSSTEGRLIVSGADAAANVRMQFDCMHYQDACAQRNVCDRPWGTFAAPDLAAAAVPGFDCCYDCARELGAWRAYASLPPSVRAPAVQSLADLMLGLTEITGQRLDGGAKMPVKQIVAAATGSFKARGTRLHGFRPDLCDVPSVLTNSVSRLTAPPFSPATVPPLRVSRLP